MNLVPLIKGAVIGFIVSVPVGPVWLLCMRRTIEKGRWAGFISGLGAAAADALYGGIAVFGIASVSRLLSQYSFALHILGGCVLLYFGIKMYHRKVETDKDNRNNDQATR